MAIDIKKTYDFFIAHHTNNTTFTPEELGKVAGLSGSTPKTYLSKQFKSIVNKKSKGVFSVKNSFAYVPYEKFKESISQKEMLLPNYTRLHNPQLVVYEFLMPLTKEDALRATLDNLFYKDSLIEWLNKLGTVGFAKVFPKMPSEDPIAYIARLASEISSYFRGYSIVHVQGRFLADDLKTQEEALGKRYIVDETTAVVRFIIPCKTSETTSGDFFSTDEDITAPTQETIREVKKIRYFFINIFAEVIAHQVMGEDEIWLIEDALDKKSLFKWAVNE